MLSCASSGTGSYSRLTGWQAEKMLVKLEIFKACYRSNFRFTQLIYSIISPNLIGQFTGVEAIQVLINYMSLLIRKFEACMIIVPLKLIQLSGPKRGVVSL